MRRAPNGLSHFGRRLLRPRSWPVRWRLAAVSSLLTFVILVLFGGAIGQIATQRIRDDFNNEVDSAVQILASELEVVYPPFGEPEAREGPQLDAFALADDASVRLYDAEGTQVNQSENAVPMGPLKQGLSDYHGTRVATEPILNESHVVTGYVQYGRSLNHVEDTIDRVWLRLAAGVLGGTVRAVFAGVAIAGRAMRPIASVTAAG